MGLEKAIEHGKEKRKPYKGAKAVDCSCRNHGSCEWCRGNRTYNTNKKREKAISEMKEALSPEEFQELYTQRPK
jgi:hypothetical protein